MSVARQLGPETFAHLDPDLLRALFDHSPDCLLLLENERIPPRQPRLPGVAGALQLRGLGRPARLCCSLPEPLLPRPFAISQPLRASRVRTTCAPRHRDHAAARHSMQSTLLDAGFRVLQAPGGKRALKLFADHARQVDLLVADCMMPGMDGHELAEQLRRQKPDRKVLLISGYRSHRAPSVPSSVRLIHKPFSRNELIERIREVLDSTGDLPC